MNSLLSEAVKKVGLLFRVQAGGFCGLAEEVDGQARVAQLLAAGRAARSEVRFDAGGVIPAQCPQQVEFEGIF